MWSPAAGYVDRVIVPFYQDGMIVGYTGRKITEGKPKYLTDAQPGYVFNIDAQTADRKYVIVVEGQFDAIAVDGCAIMHNEPNKTQIMRLNTLQREVIVVPDKDKPGAKMLKAAIENKWSVSLPPWGDDVKDVADAVKKYGRLYVITTILHYKESNEIKIQLLKKKLEGLNG
jgi:DNA primase